MFGDSEIPWTLAKNCLWNVTEQESWQIYSGRVIIHNQEWVSNDQWRIIRSVLRVKIRFQRFVSVEQETTFTGQNIQNFAITKQIVGLNLGDPALIEIGTLVPWPFELYQFKFTKFPEEKVAHYNLSFTTCTSQYSKPCRQYYTTVMHLEEGTCTLDGSYELTFNVDCDEVSTANSNCSLGTGASDHITSVQYKLKSENFCATISVDIGIIGTISSHENQSFIGSKSSFVIGRRVYYLVKVNSDLNGPKDSQGKVIVDQYDPNNSQTIIKFTRTELVKVDVRVSNGTAVRIWQRGATNTAGSDCKNHTTKEAPTSTLLLNSVGFSFVMTREIASPPKNGKVQVRIIAEVQVSYPNAKKRADSLDTTNYESDMDVEDDTVDTTTPTTGNTVPTTGTTTGGPTTGSTTGSTTGGNTVPTTGSTTAGPTTGSTTAGNSSNSVALIASLIMLIVALI